MAKANEDRDNVGIGRPKMVPPGATRKAFDREDNGGGPPGSPLGDRHAAGDPGGGAEFGGLAGSNVDDGTPVEEEPPEPDGPYAGHSGGAVGGSPAEGRSSGGRTHGGLAPGSSHRGDSTIGSDPEKTEEGRRGRKGRSRR
jgi:hypothetical protein